MKSSTPPPTFGRTNILSKQSGSRIANTNNCNGRPSRFDHMTTTASQHRASSASKAHEMMKKGRKAAKDLLDKGGPEAKRLLAEYESIPADPEEAQREIDAIAGGYQYDESDSGSNRQQKSTEDEQQRKKTNPGRSVNSESEKGSVTSISPPTHREKGRSFDHAGKVPRDTVVKSSASQGSGGQGRASSSLLKGNGERPSASQSRKPPTGSSGGTARDSQVGGSAR